MTIYTYILYCVVSNNCPYSQQCSHLNLLTYLEGLDGFRFFSKKQYCIVRCNQALTISDERFPMKTLAEIAPISARILVRNRSSEISDRKLPISDSVRNGFFLPSGNRQFPMEKNASIKKRS